MDKDKRGEIHITNNFNAPIGQHIDHVDVINFRMDGEGNFHFGMVEEASVGENNLPGVLATDRAMKLWEAAREAGWVDEHFQPLLSRTLSAVLADRMATRLGITNKWKVFEAFWKRNNMRGDYNDALEQKQYTQFYEKMSRVI